MVPPQMAARLAELARARTEADAALKVAVVEALKAGGSVREVMRMTGLSTQTVSRWGHAGGWPTPAQVRAREEATERRRAIARKYLGIEDE